MIDEDAFGLGGFELVESSEQGMLAAGAARATQRQGPIVFLGWEPHPMNTNFELTYLTGGDDVFGPNFGGATVYTNVRKGYLEECPNVGKLLQNLEFTLPWRTRSWAAILDDGEEPEDAASDWLKANPARARRLARRRHHLRRRRRAGRGQGAVSASERPGRRPVRGRTNDGPRAGGGAMDWLTAYKIPLGKLDQDAGRLAERRTPRGSSTASPGRAGRPDRRPDRR